MPQSRRDRYNILHGQLRTERSSFESHWRELAENITPRRARFTISDNNRGDRRNQKIIDSTATFAARTLSSGMMSGVTSPARPWFRLTTPDAQLSEFGPVKTWCDEVRERMATVFARSNLYSKLPTLYGDLGVFSTGVLGVFEDDETVIRCQDFPVGSYYLANDEKLRCRVFLREFRMTARQIVERFCERTPGGEYRFTNVSKPVENSWKNSREDWYNIVHIVTPNDDYDPEKLHSKYKRFSSCYYEWGSVGSTNQQQSEDVRTDTFLEESGYDEFPILAARWETSGEDVYGTNGPGMVALGDVKQLQLGEKRGFQAIEKMVNPPLIMPPEFRNTVVSQLPGGITYGADPTAHGARPLHEVRFSLAELENKQIQARQRIERAFFADLFLMLQYGDQSRGTQPVTAREIEERHEEKLLALGPVLEQLNNDVLDPLIDRTFAIMDRRGLLPDPPPELQGVPLKIEYVSIMAQAQKLVGLSSLERFSGFVGSLVAETQRTDMLDKVDFDQLIDEYGDGAGVPSRVVVPDDKVAEIRKARAAAAAKQQAAQQVAALAPAAKQLSETNTSGKNALTDLLGGQVGGASPTMVS